MYVCMYEGVCVCVFAWFIVEYYCVWAYTWCLVYVCLKIHTLLDILEVVFRIGERRYVANFATGRPEKKFCICFFMCLCAYLWR